MREILFRAKRTFNNEWVEGGYHSRFGKSYIIGISKTERIDGVEVIPDTVGQYTGLADKNGKKIFEGDIIDIQYPDTFVANAVVEYVGASFVASTDYDMWELDEFVSLEVIGDIHDNLELLKGE